MTIKERRLALLEETVNHFNSQNRNYGKHPVTEKSGCFYFPTHANTEGCAIGRKINDKELCKEFDLKTEYGVAAVFDRLPEELKELGSRFLSNLQHLHDDSLNWVGDGISEGGKREAERIKREFCV